MAVERLPCVILLWLEALEGPANTSIQNISGLPRGRAGHSAVGSAYDRVRRLLVVTPRQE